MNIALVALFAGATCIALSPIWVRLADVGPTASAFWRVALAVPLLWALYGAAARGSRAAPAPRAHRGYLAAAGVAVRVRDRGIGIPRDQLKQIFKRFYRVQLRMASKVKGTGLGLFIVRSVVSKHGGKTFAESPGEGLGSTFTIQLPRVWE